MKRLIVTADDYGASLPINEAVEEACRSGVLTTASLMVGGAAVQDAVARAWRTPKLRVGLHVVLVCGRPLLPPHQVPDLAPGGALPDDLFAAGVRFFFRPQVRRQLAAEIRAQFDAFKATGLPLDHVNAHNHMHLHPTVCSLILAIGRDYGLNAMRVPYEPPSAFGKISLTNQVVNAAVIKPWVRVLSRRLQGAGVRHNDYVFGLRNTGHMTADQMLRAITDLPEATSEIYVHPATRKAVENGLPADYECEEEFSALVDPRVADALHVRGIRLTSFSELACAC